MQTLMSMKDRYAEVTRRLARAAQRSGRSARDVLLVVVTKYADPEQILDLIELGHQDFGESRVQQLAQRAAMVQEWLDRRRTLPAVAAAHSIGRGLRDPATGGPMRTPPEVRWHMIGPLQRNKAKKAVEHARLIHSVDSLRLGEEIHAAAMRRDHIADVLLQVNASGEPGKHGVSLPAARHVAEQLDTMVHVRLRGLMTMAPLVDDPEDARPTFERTRDAFDEIRAAGVAAGHFNILSMGMSNDFEIAIECGANLVRVGSAIVGERRDRRDDDPQAAEG
ncbi:MAG: YggS family pyridoxal phosphate-dependent enzyme [Planctomycetota bacterium]|nr:MAG: YggS family pyridoxal phosphate-dependent enzyme [Planctomycetota bacterium]